jgi:hypothetical protein
MHAISGSEGTIVMQSLRCATFGLAASIAMAAAPAAAAHQTEPADGGRPRIALRAQPNVGMSPARVVLTAELVGGANDFQEYYCPTVEWDWDDDTVSESTSDCEPYEAGRSEIRRRLSVEHVFRRAGTFRVTLRLKQRDKVVGTAFTTVTIRPRLGEYDQ